MDTENTGNSAGGLVMVYTGNGKGKTTAALGLALRQVGWGRRVLFIQFMKGKGNVYGERMAAEKYLPLLEIEQYGQDDFVNLSDPGDRDTQMAGVAMERASQALPTGDYGLVVLDEINVAAACGLVEIEDVLALIDKRPPHVDLVLTGRYCPEAIMARADMVSEIREIKHHYAKGIQARKGVEY